MIKYFSIILSALIISTFTCGCGRSITQEFPDRNSASSAFQDEFGVMPPPEIREIRGKVLEQGDTFARWLEFSYDKATVDRILSNDWAQADQTALDSGAVWSQALKDPNLNAPAWWPKNPINQGMRIFYTEKKHSSGARRYVYLLIDLPAGRVFSKGCIWQ